MNEREFKERHAFKKKDALAAIKKVNERDVQWLYENYPKYGGNMRKSRTGFLLYKGRSYPLKPLGRLACEISERPLKSNPNTNTFRNHFKSLGFRLIKSLEKEADAVDVRQRRLAETWGRPKQAEFRLGVLSRFGSACVISGCETLEAIESAHIIPINEEGTDEFWNGLPLRADLHRLFDAGLLQIDPKNWKVNIIDAAGADYLEFCELNIAGRMEKVTDLENMAQALFKRNRIQNRK